MIETLPDFHTSKLQFHDCIHDVYFDDLDAFQILHNARYVLFFERTVSSFWRRIGWAGVLSADRNPDQYHLVRANHVDYLRPVTGLGPVRVRTWVEKLGRTSLTFGFVMLPAEMDADAGSTSGGPPFATGTRVVVRVDPDLKHSAEWTDGFRQRLEPFRRDLHESGSSR